MNIDYEEFKKQLGKDVTIVADGIGNVSIDYEVKTHDGRRKLSFNLGGYTDMEPFKWEITTGWKVKGRGKSGDTSYGQPWDIVSTGSMYVETEYGGGHYDVKAKKYIADSEYLEFLLKRRETAKEMFDELAAESKQVFDEMMGNVFSYRVEKNYLTRKWEGYLTYKGNQFSTKKHKTFFEAKNALDAILAEQQDNDGGN